MIWKKQPVGSKLSDLQNNKASKDTATQSAAGLMSASDKTKLDGIATGATAVSVVNNLNSDSTTSALSAAQGKALNSKITSLITTETKTQPITWASTSNAYYEGYTDISKTGYTPIGIIGYEVTGSLASAVVVSAIEIGSNNRAWISARMISFTPSSTTGNNIVFTALYIKNE